MTNCQFQAQSLDSFRRAIIVRSFARGVVFASCHQNKSSFCRAFKTVEEAVHAQPFRPPFPFQIVPFVALDCAAARLAFAGRGHFGERSGQPFSGARRPSAARRRIHAFGATTRRTRAARFDCAAVLLGFGARRCHDCDRGRGQRRSDKNGSTFRGRRFGQRRRRHRFR